MYYDLFTSLFFLKIGSDFQELQPRLLLWLTLSYRTSFSLLYRWLYPSFRSCPPKALRRNSLFWIKDIVLLAIIHALRRLRMALLSLAMGMCYIALLAPQALNPLTFFFFFELWRAFADKLINIIGISFILYLIRVSGLAEYLSPPESAEEQSIKSDEYSIKCPFCRKETTSKVSWSIIGTLEFYIFRTSC